MTTNGDINETLADDLKEALGAVFSDILDENNIAKREENAIARQKKRDLIALKQKKFESYVSNWEWLLTRNNNEVPQIVESFTDDLIAYVWRAYKSGKNVPISINSEQRFEAFQKMDNRDILIQRIGQTLDTAEKTIKYNASIDVADSSKDVLDSFNHYLGLLGAIKIRFAKDVLKARKELEEDQTIRGVYYESNDAMLDDIKGLIASSFESLSEGFFNDFDNEESKLNDEFDQMVRKVDNMVELHLLERAEKVEGFKFDLSFINDEIAGSTVSYRYQPEELLNLLFEVRRSFDTYKKILNDNGVFAAFLGGSNFGSVDAGVWFGEVEHSKKCVKLNKATTIKATGKNRCPQFVIEKMKEFNTERYWGPLDEGYAAHVDHFWFGFKFLMEFINDMCIVDDSKIKNYMKHVESELKKQSIPIAASMNDEQISLLREDLNAILMKLK